MCKCEEYVQIIKKETTSFKKVMYMAFAVFGAVSISLGASMLIGYGTLSSTSKYQEERIQHINRTYVSGDLFILFAKTYELQTSEIIAIKEGDKDAIKSSTRNYRELRLLILEQIQLNKTRGTYENQN